MQCKIDRDVNETKPVEVASIPAAKTQPIPKRAGSKLKKAYCDVWCWFGRNAPCRTRQGWGSKRNKVGGLEL